jgi:O-antigen ligase
MKTSTLTQIGLVSAGLFLSLLAGFATTILPWWLILPVFLLPVIVWVSWALPVVALVFLLLAILGVVPTFSSKVPFSLMIAFVVFMWINRWQYIKSSFDTYRKIWVALACFVVWCGFSVVYGMKYQMNYPVYVYVEATGLLYWLLLMGAVLVAHDERSANILLRVIVGVSVILCCMSLAQSLFGLRLLFSAESRVEILDESSGGLAGVARSLVPGMPLVLFSYFSALLAIARKAKMRWLWSIVLLITISAIFVSFGRALWGLTALMTLVSMALVGRRAFFRFTLIALVGGGVLFGILSAVKPAVIDAFVNRILSVFSEGRASSSLGWRLTENYFAIPKILSHLWMGLGLGAEYKPRLIDLKLFTEQTHYIHNGYLYIALKLGVIGFLSYVLLYFRFLEVCFKGFSFRMIEYTPRVAVAAVLLLTLLLNFTQPELMTAGTIACLSVLIPLAHQARFAGNETRKRPA